jgi:hypothetical protein
MFDTSEDIRKLKRKETLMLVYTENGLQVPMKNKRQVLTMLGAYKGSSAWQYAKKENLDMSVPADVVKLITFIEKEKL